MYTAAQDSARRVAPSGIDGLVLRLGRAVHAGAVVVAVVTSLLLPLLPLLAPHVDREFVLPLPLPVALIVVGVAAVVVVGALHPALYPVRGRERARSRD
jgi:hypothetical protein